MPEMDFYNWYFGSGKIIQRAITKYGKENFSKEIIETCTTEQELDTQERFWILKLNSLQPNGYNIHEGGTGGDTISHNPRKEEITKQISDTIIKNGSSAGKNNAMYGKFGNCHPAYGSTHTEQGKSNARKALAKYRLRENNYIGKNNPHYGDYRNWIDLHGETKAKEMKNSSSKNSIGEKNANAKMWKLIDPSGHEFLIKGTLKKFCKEHNLSFTSLKRYAGEVFLPKIIHRRYEEKTKNTTGWTLYEVRNNQ